MRGALHEAFLQVDSEILTRCRAEDGRDGTTAVAMLRIGQRRPFALVRCYWGHALHAALGCLQGLGALLCCGLCGSALTGRCGLATSVLYSPSLCTGNDINPRNALRALGNWCSEAEILVGGSGHPAHVQNSLFDKGTHGPTPAWACLSLPDLFTCKLETCQCSRPAPMSSCPSLVPCKSEGSQSIESCSPIVMVPAQPAARHPSPSVSSTLQLQPLCAGQVLHMAHCGDSRAVLAAPEALRLTQDHKPDLPAERERIEAAGGHVELVKCADSTWLRAVCERLV